VLPAWWALGTSKPRAAGGEIDFFEDSGTTGWHAAAARSPAANINSDLSSVDSQFHVYRADWTVSSITFSFDGTLHDDRPNPRPRLAIWPRQALLHDHQHCGHKHSAAGSPAGAQFPVEMAVNHVHVWH
jgi:hypothetical protein